MPDYQTILYEVADGVATISLNRPDVLNAFNDQMIAETTAALKAAERDDGVRCIVLTGAGRAFSSGQDLDDVKARLHNPDAPTIGEHLRHGYNPLILKMRTLEKPIIGAINGVAAGAGCSVALACDLRVCSDKASFIEVFVNVGLVPDSGSTWFLPRLVGMAKAFEMAATAQRVKADEALALGMVNRVVPAEELMAATRELALALAKAPTRAIGARL
jgi:2-(1,2-epoxy-1,2-dihydrophenyl)acetyl-CoA isomerase